MRPARLSVVVLAASIATAARAADGPADPLLRLAPPDAGVTLAVEDLRGHARTFLDSPLAAEMARLPAVQGWRASDQSRQLQKARRDIEAALGTDLARVRDDLLGDAVVLSLRVRPGADPDGLLLLRARDRALLERLIRAINDAERQGGTLVEVVERTRGATTYSVRRFRPGTKPDEAYVLLGPDTFAWSNSEDLIRGVIDRRSGPPGLGADPRFRRVRSALPAGAVASLFVDPRFVERMAAEPKPPTPGEGLAAEAMLRYLAAVEYAGLALEWRDGLILHAHEAIDPSKLDACWRRWAARPGGAAPLVRRVPPTALALAACHIDFAALGDAALGLVPEASRSRADLALLALRGVLLDRDPRADILPYLGPGVLAYIDAPAEGESAPLVVVLGLGDDSAVPAALDNALRTLFALTALDPKRAGKPLAIASRTLGAVRVTTLAGGVVPLSYAVERGMLVLGTSAEAVASYCAADPDGPGPARLARLRAAYFPEAESFAFVDLEGFGRWADAHRPQLARRLGAGARDLDPVLALLGLFRAGFATSTLAPDFSSTHRTLGLIAREPTPK
jgi:hypothetical protein